jgi:lipopolysaccharide transport system ATP-binding protein
MTVRLGFAVATAMDPDVLILDEVLAVGDVNFRLKCYQRISKIRAKSAIIFVSHNTDQLIQVCSRGVVINAGRIMAEENIEKAIAYYGELTKTILNGASSIVQDEMKNLRIDCPQRFSFGEKLPIQIEYFSEKKVESCDLKIHIRDTAGLTIAELYTRTRGVNLSLERGKNRISIKFGPLHLKKGKYHMALALLDRNTNEHLHWSERIQDLESVNEFTTGGVYQVPAEIEMLKLE